jgi:hypothetical protein
MAATGSTEQELLICASFLVKRKDSTHTLQEVYVNNITKKAYHFYWRRTDGSYYGEWLEKEEFERKYEIFELLREEDVTPSLKDDYIDYKVNINPYPKQSTEYIDCPICNGMGTLPDPDTTTGSKPCPKCWGSGKTYKMILND